MMGLVSVELVVGFETGNSLVKDLFGKYNGPRAPHPVSRIIREVQKTREEMRGRILYLCNTVRMVF